MTKILAFAGSTRIESFNKKLLQVAVAGARDAGAEVTVIDLLDFPMPIFNQDLEAAEGMPEHAGRFKQLLIKHDGFLISSPEYNSCIPALLKNAIDWASRAEPQDTAPMAAYRGKVAGIMAATPGGNGGMRSLLVLRLLLEYIGVIVIPNQQSLSRANLAFADNGSLLDAEKKKAVEGLAADLTSTLIKLKS